MGTKSKKIRESIETEILEFQKVKMEKNEERILWKK